MSLLFSYGFDNSRFDHTKTTVVVVDNSCSSSYTDWLKENSLFITSTYVKDGVKFHHYKDDEIIIVLTPVNSIQFVKSYKFKKGNEGKFLFFGKDSIDIMFGGVFEHYVQRSFGRNYRFIVPNEGCNKSYFEEEQGC